MKQEIKSENTAKDNLDYNQDYIEEEPLDIKIEREDWNDNLTEKDIQETNETTSENICLNLDYLKVSLLKVETSEDSQVLQKGSEFDVLNSFVTFDNTGGVDNSESDNPNKPNSRKLFSRKLYHCNVCDYSTNNKYTIKEHENMHTGKRPHTCLNCNFRFKYRSNLLSHSNKCFLSGPKFKLKRNKVNNELLYYCKVCDYSTTNKTYLSNHQVSHSGERPYTCLKCSFSFKYKRNLDFHSKKCSGKKVRGVEFKYRNKNQFTNSSSDETEFYGFDGNLSYDDVRHDESLSSACNQQKVVIGVRHNTNFKQSKNKEILEKTLHSDENFTSLDLNCCATEKEEIKETLRSGGGDSKLEEGISTLSINLNSFGKKSEENSASSHKANDRNTEMLRCTECEYIAQTPTQMTVHKALHVNSILFKCLKCNYGTNREWDYFRHKRTFKCKNNKPEEHIMESASSSDDFLDEIGCDAMASDSSKTSSKHKIAFKEKRFRRKRLKVAIELNKELNQGKELSHPDKMNLNHQNFVESDEKSSNNSVASNTKNKSSCNNSDIDLDGYLFSTSENECDKELGSKRKRSLRIMKRQTEKDIDSDNSEYFPDNELCFRSKKRFSKRINKRKLSSLNEKYIKGNSSESEESDDNSISSKTSCSVGTSSQHNPPESNENTDEEINNCSNISEVNLNMNQSNETDIDEQLFKYFPADSEDIYGDDTLIQIFFQKPKVLLEKLKSHFCAQCDYVTHSSSELEAHKYETHLRSKKYECLECGYNSVTCLDLKSHEETHKQNMCDEIISSDSEKEMIEIERTESNPSGDACELSEDKPKTDSPLYNVFFNDEWSNCQVTKNNKDNQKVDLGYFYNITCKVINNIVKSMSSDSLGIKFNQKLLGKNAESSANFLGRDHKRSQNDQEFIKPVDKTSYEYLSKAVKIYNEFLSDSDEIEIESDETNFGTEENIYNGHLIRSDIVSQEVLSELLEYLKCKNDANKKSNEGEKDTSSQVGFKEFFSNTNFDNCTSSSSSSLGHSEESDSDPYSKSKLFVTSNTTKDDTCSSLTNVEFIGTSIDPCNLNVISSKKSKIHRKSFFCYNSFSLKNKNKHCEVEKEEKKQIMSSIAVENPRFSDDVIITDEIKSISVMPTSLNSKYISTNELNKSLHKITTTGHNDNFQEESISISGNNLKPSFMYKDDVSERNAIGSLNIKSKDNDMLNIQPLHVNEVSSFEPPQVVKTVTENSNMLNIDKSIEHSVNILNNADTTVCGNILTANNFINAQEFPENLSYVSYPLTANGLVDFNSNSNYIILVPSNLNINVAVPPSPIIYSNNELPIQAVSFPTTSGITEDSNNFLIRSVPDPSINHCPTSTSYLSSGYSSSHFNNESGSQDKIKMEVDDTSDQQKSVQPVDSKINIANSSYSSQEFAIQPQLITNNESNISLDPLVNEKGLEQFVSMDNLALKAKNEKSTILKDFLSQKECSPKIPSKEIDSDICHTIGPEENEKVIIPFGKCKVKNINFYLDGDFIFKCNKCNYSTNIRKYFSRHYLEVHVGKKRFKCNICDYTAYHRYQVVNHFVTHNPVREIRCKKKKKSTKLIKDKD